MKSIFTVAFAFLLSLSALVASLHAQASPGAPASAPAGASLTLVHLCDPQLGFGADGFDADVARFEQAIRQINALVPVPDAVLIAGDLVNIPDVRSNAAFRAAVAKFKSPVILTPGNHDINDSGSKAVTPAALARYRAVHGSDFVVREIKGRLLISANSQLWWKGGPADEIGKQNRLLADAFHRAREKGLPVILLTHVAPFEKTFNEKDAYFNLPKVERRRLLDALNGSRGILWLAGHSHTTSRRVYKNITILNGETTSRNFDKHAFGFRLLRLDSGNNFTWDFVPLASK